jgi:hypothetical protein
MVKAVSSGQYGWQFKQEELPMSIRTIVNTLLANYAVATTGAAVRLHSQAGSQRSFDRGVRCAIQ